MPQVADDGQPLEEKALYGWTGSGWLPLKVDASGHVVVSGLPAVLDYDSWHKTSGDQNVSSTSYVDVTGATVSVTVAVAALVVIIGTFRHNNTGANVSYGRIVQGASTDVSGDRILSVGTSIVNSTVWALVAVAAGSHSFKLQGKTSAGTLVVSHSGTGLLAVAVSR